MLTSFVRSSQGQRILSGVVLWLSALCFAVALNLFYVPNLIFSNGVPGLAQIILAIFKNTPLANLLTAGNLYFILNIPLMILSWLYLGRRFSILTVTSIFLSTLVSNWVPWFRVSGSASWLSLVCPVEALTLLPSWLLKKQGAMSALCPF